MDYTKILASILAIVLPLLINSVKKSLTKDNKDLEKSLVSMISGLEEDNKCKINNETVKLNWVLRDRREVYINRLEIAKNDEDKFYCEKKIAEINELLGE